jgi:hypothetical protein
MNTTLSCLARIDRLTWLLIAAFVALGGYLLWDRGDVLAAALTSALPWLLILACPLMHLWRSWRAPERYEASGL